MSSYSSSGIGFTGLLVVAFIVLKLIGIIAWSWWWVLSPIWISISLMIFILGILWLIYYIFKRRGTENLYTGIGDKIKDTINKFINFFNV